MIKIHVDEHKCVGAGQCVMTAPQVFDQREDPSAYVTVILPEFVPRKLWQHLLHNQHALLIKGALLFKPNVIVTSVPFHLGRHPQMSANL